MIEHREVGAMATWGNSDDRAAGVAPPTVTANAAVTAGTSQPLVLSVREAAAMLRISKDLAYELIGRGELPALRLGRRVVVPTKALMQFVDESTSVGR
jgi:excisionase family DNA binding protein